MKPRRASTMTTPWFCCDLVAQCLVEEKVVQKQQDPHGGGLNH